MRREKSGKEKPSSAAVKFTGVGHSPGRVPTRISRGAPASSHNILKKKLTVLNRCVSWKKKIKFRIPVFFTK